MLTGLEVQLHDGQTISTRSALLSVHADLPAKAMLINMNQFNGQYACLYCYHPGETARTSKGGHKKMFPGNLHHRLRTAADVKVDARCAETTKKTVIIQLLA